jgi:hypothetical protein
MLVRSEHAAFFMGISQKRMISRPEIGSIPCGWGCVGEGKKGLDKGDGQN